MPYGMYISAEGVQAQSRRMETIANNLANVNTVGFKRDFATFQARHAEAITQGLEMAGEGGLPDLGGGIELSGTITEFAPGPLDVTGMPTDVAIDGKGFFVVRDGDTNFLTRAGNFTLDPTGTLRTQDGAVVMSDAGTPVAIDPDQPWSVAPDGAIEQGDVRIPLALVQPRSQGDLVKQGTNRFLPLAATMPVPVQERHVLAGTLEMSGVNPTTSMMELIETSRAIEANMKLIQNQDHMIGQLVSRILQG